MTNLSNSLTWQAQLARAVRDPAEFIALLELDPALIPAAELASRQFALRVPHSFIARMQKGNSLDPLLKQVLPLDAELRETPEYNADPLAESEANPVPGLLHKYHGRVLLTLTGACAVNCRFCFRRHFPYAENNPGSAGWERALTYIAENETINEVILSGGDPLTVSDNYIDKFVQKLARINHVKTLRIHSRFPIMISERITPELICALTSTRLKSVLVLHCNHANEIDAALAEKMLMLRGAGITLLNQTVLLKGVNDNVAALTDLSDKLFATGILPYYLHMPDKVQGTAHFAVEDAHALNLHWRLSQKLAGYLVPKLVREIPGAPAKVPLGRVDYPELARDF